MSCKERNRVLKLELSEMEDLVVTSPHSIRVTAQATAFDIDSVSSIKFSSLVGIGIYKEIIGTKPEDLIALRDWLTIMDDFVFGYFSYDAKNLTESLQSKNLDRIGFPAFHFFVPKVLCFVDADSVHGYCHGEMPEVLKPAEFLAGNLGTFANQLQKKEYVEAVKKLQSHIQFGDIYEVNYCIEHSFEHTTIDPYRLYQELQKVSPAPFSCFVADQGKYLMSSSPERFIKKSGTTLISQPMKGTNRKTSDNETQKANLRNDQKEVAENIMITDLVRNDLSRSAKKGSVKVNELCGVYEFEHVNQMISTVTAELRDDVHPLDAILNAFPMGSMTGAPKIRAMELIDEYEDFSRGLYSGAVGYFTPDLDFDFNVVIRSVLYNEETKVVTFPTGSAITINSDPEKEYDECMLKAEAMRKVLLNHAK